MSRTAESFDPTAPAGVFTSRWWGIVSTVYLVLAPLALAGIFLVVMFAGLMENARLRIGLGFMLPFAVAVLLWPR